MATQTTMASIKAKMDGLRRERHAMIQHIENLEAAAAKERAEAVRVFTAAVSVAAIGGVFVGVWLCTIL